MLTNKEGWEKGDMDVVLWCRMMQDKCLDEGNEKGAMEYYELAKLWMQRVKDDE